MFFVSFKVFTGNNCRGCKKIQCVPIVNILLSLSVLAPCNFGLQCAQMGFEPTYLDTNSFPCSLPMEFIVLYILTACWRDAVECHNFWLSCWVRRCKQQKLNSFRLYRGAYYWTVCSDIRAAFDSEQLATTARMYKMNWKRCPTHSKASRTTLCSDLKTIRTLVIITSYSMHLLFEDLQEIF